MRMMNGRHNFEPTSPRQLFLRILSELQDPEQSTGQALL